MKKALIIFLIGVFALTMVACGSEKAAEKEKAEPEVVKIERLLVYSVSQKLFMK